MRGSRWLPWPVAQMPPSSPAAPPIPAAPSELPLESYFLWGVKLTIAKLEVGTTSTRPIVCMHILLIFYLYLVIVFKNH